MQRSVTLFFFFLILAELLLTRCANPVSPTGGPKDTTPPKVTVCDPPNFATRFEEHSFRIDFNEFINLKNPANEIFISPPLKSHLDPRIRGKSVVIKFEDTLAANTTYSVSFGNSIADLTEGNILKGFSYVFSTGDFVDTLSLQGNLHSAFDLKPQKDVFIELYINNNDTIQFDSLPLRVAPYYITKSDDQGNFVFHNLRNEPYKLFALADQNGDLIFNQPSEKIAFYDSLVKPYYILIPKPDTSQKDSTKITPAKFPLKKIMNPDSLRKSDSIHKADSIKQNFLRYPFYPLFLFEQIDSIQRLMNSTFPKKGMALLVFKFPVNNLRVVPLNFDSIAPWCIEEYSRQRDSVRLWITRPGLDSLVAKVIIGDKTMDTVRLEVPKKENSKKSSDKEKQDRLGLSIPAAGTGFNQYKNKLVGVFSFPLVRWDFRKVLLISDKDTTHPEIKFTDSLKRRISIFGKWKEDKAYKIIVPDSVFFGIQGITHDSIKIDFRTKGEKDFGNLIVSMNMEKRPGQYIVQLLNEKESVVYEEQIVTGSGKISFNFMPPGKYKLKAINDRNKNNRWDTGNYKLNIQPEEVIYLPKIIEIRANWDVEETWD